jgi:site-specific DNA-methyltransferase (adenine-specific)
MSRRLLEKGSDSFIRFNEAIPILRKIQKLNEIGISTIVSGNDPFGFDVRVDNSYERIHPDFKKTQFKDRVQFYFNGWQKEGVGFIARRSIRKNRDWIDQYKVFINQVYGERGGFPYRVLGTPFFGDKNTCCKETYLVIGPFTNKRQVSNVISYIETKFFRFLVLLTKNTQHAPRKVYQFVPMQDFTEAWTDEKLYKKYRLTVTQIAFIESLIRPIQAELFY